jgi:hypothetical protein
VSFVTINNCYKRGWGRVVYMWMCVTPSKQGSYYRRKGK